MTSLVKSFVSCIGLKGRTLDVGSYDVNGSAREFFTDYTGVDM